MVGFYDAAYSISYHLLISYILLLIFVYDLFLYELDLFWYIAVVMNLNDLSINN